jgi:hypothetical protein
MVNDQPQRLNRLILSESPSLDRYAANNPAWVSPLAENDYIEYQGRQFLAAVGLQQIFGATGRFLAEKWPCLGRPC